MNPVPLHLPIIHTDGLGMMIIYQSGEYLQLVSSSFVSSEVFFSFLYKFFFFLMAYKCRMNMN